VAVASRLRRLMTWLLVAAVCGYALALLAVILGFRLIGERWWVTTVGLYLPQAGFALPWPVLTVALAIWGPRRLLLVQLLTAWMVAVPLMGLQISRPARPAPDATTFRVLSYNVNWGRRGDEALLRQLEEARADIILMQEVGDRQRGLFRSRLPGYHFDTHTEFFLASRFPIQETFKPPEVVSDERNWAPRFVRYTLQTPRGAIDVFHVHPLSPREGLQDLRGDGLRYEVTSGRIFEQRAARSIVANTSLRLSQLQSVSEHARRSPRPVLIAGDTNVPHHSWALKAWFSEYQDGFSEAGSGFGYTFPADQRPWMRIDRVLAGPPFRFFGFSVSPAFGSDHLCVIADIEMR
jgi:vancomycin resistance protein VanJ